MYAFCVDIVNHRFGHSCLDIRKREKSDLCDNVPSVAYFTFKCKPLHIERTINFRYVSRNIT